MATVKEGKIERQGITAGGKHQTGRRQQQTTRGAVVVKSCCVFLVPVCGDKFIMPVIVALVSGPYRATAAAVTAEVIER